MAKQIMPDYIGQGLATLSSSLGDISRNKIAQQQLALQQQAADRQQQQYEKENAPIDPEAIRSLTDVIGGKAPASNAPAEPAIKNYGPAAIPNPSDSSGLSYILDQQKQQQQNDQPQGIAAASQVATSQKLYNPRDYALAQQMRDSQIKQTAADIAARKEASGESLNKALAYKAYGLGDQASAKADQLGTANPQQDKALQSTQSLLESARGNPAAAQAERDIYAAQKAKTLANIYGDPNKLSMPQVQLLASEVAKIAQGGAPTMSELQGLTPQTLTGKLSSITSVFTNKPTPANAAAFVKQYTDYTDSLSKDAQKVIEDKYGRVIESRKRQLGQDNYNTLKSNYIDRFKGQEQAQDLNASQKRIMAASPPAPEGYVTVYKGGQAVGHIPKGNLDKAKAQGYSEAP